MARRRRAGGDLSSLLTFGGRLPAAMGGLLAAMLVATVGSWITRGLVLGLLALDPARVLVKLELWRVATWPLVQGDPIGLAFVAMMLWWMGAQLAYEWSERTLLVRMTWIVLGAGVATTAVAWLWGRDVVHSGAWPVANALLFMWALQHPDAELRWFFAISTTGKVVAWVLVVGTMLYGVYLGGVAGIAQMVPHLAALGVAWVLLQRRTGARRTFSRTRQRWEEWQLRRRAKHLRVVKKDGTDGRGPWLN